MRTWLLVICICWERCVALPDSSACEEGRGGEWGAVSFSALHFAQASCTPLHPPQRGVRQDLATAREHFAAAAEDGDSLSLANLGYMYFKGLGVERDPSLAREFLRSPVDAGLASAMTTLGVMYATGEGEAADADTAFALFTRAAEANFADAHFNLAHMHLSGLAPTGRDLRLARQHFKAAASTNHVQALAALGVMEAQGIGGPRDCTAALSCLNNVIMRLPMLPALEGNGLELLAAGNTEGTCGGP